MAVALAKWKIKDPSDIADYWFDWGSTEVPATQRFLPDSENITTHTVTVPAGITKVADSHTGKMVRVRLSGGTAEDDYDITCLIETDAGQTFEQTKTLFVRERAS